MCRKNVTTNVQKSHKVLCGKRGFTVVELSVVLALMAILVTLIISFSVLMSGFSEGNKVEYAFLKEHAALKDALCSWVAENDGPDSVFSIDNDGTLTVTANGNERTVYYTDGALSLVGARIMWLDAIDGVVFTVNDKLIKCVTYRNRENGEPIECSFVLCIRSGRIEEVAGNE